MENRYFYKNAKGNYSAFKDEQIREELIPVSKEEYEAYIAERDAEFERLRAEARANRK